MAKGPFGNPLSTGIALSGVIDMVTPVRQAQERKRKRQAEEKAAGDERAKELGAIMGKITVDKDKIWWRYHDDARSQYANTIDKVQQMYGAGDLAGMYKTIDDFDSRMTNYTQATTLKNKRREELAKGKYYMDSNLENMSESRDVDNEEYGKLLTESGYGAYGEDRMFSYMPNAEIYDIKSSWETELKGDEKVFIKEGEKDVTQVGKAPSGIIVTKDYNPSVITRAHQKIRSDIYRDPYRAARILENNGYDVSSIESITDPTQRAEKTLEMFDDYIMKNRPGVGQQVLNVRAARTTKVPNTREGVMGKVQISEGQQQEITTEGFDINGYKKGLLPVIEAKVLEIIKASGVDNEKGVTAELDNVFQNLITTGLPNDWFSGENRISVNDTTGTPVVINLNNKSAAAKQIAEILLKSNEKDIQAMGVNVGYNYAAPSTVIKKFDKTASVTTIGADVKKSYEMPKGEIYMVGSKGAQVVEIKNATNVAGSLFQTFNRDEDGKIWHGIDFPVEEPSAIKSMLEQALGKKGFDDFEKSSGIPKTFYVPETKTNVATFLTTDSQGKLTEEFLNEELIKRGVYGSVTPPSGGAAKRTEIKESEIAAAASASGRSEAEYRQLLQDNGIKIVP